MINNDHWLFIALNDQWGNMSLQTLTDAWKSEPLAAHLFFSRAKTNKNMHFEERASQKDAMNKVINIQIKQKQHST